jgi:O-methyltransferase involved in polyketide biosynthesis
MDVTESISSTALMAAALRAAEAAHPRPLFEDRFAPLFAVDRPVEVDVVLRSDRARAELERRSVVEPTGRWPR